jgi:hydroxymethylbilane synthase
MSLSVNLPVLRIATRRSKLALAQSHWVKAQLEARQPGLTVELREYVTRGDQIQDRPLQQVGGKGLFTKEIEDALLAGEADLAVHSLKDLPAQLPPGLILAAIPEREDPRDALVLPSGAGLAGDGLTSVPHGALVGSSSFRRSAQILAVRPDVRVESVRGNVDTRLRKLDEGQYDALILAAAGLRRLGLAERISAALPPELSTPAPAQGALGIEAREDDPVLAEYLTALDDRATRIAVAAERALMEALGGGCSIPLGAYAHIDAGLLHLQALVALPDGSRSLRASDSGSPDDPETLGEKVAGQLRDQGAEALLASISRP